MLGKSEEKVRKAADNRPITVLNGDYKLLTGILADRLNAGLAEVVGELQTGFIAGRFIGDNVILIRDLIAYQREIKTQQALIFLDFRKAYDRVRWSWLWRVMEHIGLEGRFLDLTRACYAAPSVTLMLEGVSLGNLHPSRGVRQGCPLSPLLFALSIEPLHHALRTRQDLRGVPLPLRADGSQPPPLRTALFAGDVSLFPRDEPDARAMLGVVKEFGHASGSALNQSKSKVVMCLTTDATHFAGLQVVGPGSEVKSLGMVYGPLISPTQQWDRIAARMRSRVKGWQKRKGLSIWGRVAVANSLISSTATYLAAFTQPTDQQLSDMDDLIWSSIWGGDGSTADMRRGWMSREAAQRSAQEGGLGLILPSMMVRSRQLAMLHRALLHKSALWSIFLQNWLCQWGDPWAEGWDNLTLPPPSAARGCPWYQPITAWRKLPWSAPIPDNAWEARAVSVWSHPALPKCAKLRNSIGAVSLAKAGYRRVNDFWDAGHRRWLDPAVITSQLQGKLRAEAKVTYGLVMKEVSEWLGDSFDSLLLDLPPPLLRAPSGGTLMLTGGGRSYQPRSALR